MKLRPYLIAIFVTAFFTVATANAAVFTVSKTADTDDGVCDADCSLREAINAVNANGTGADVIDFDIPGSGVKTITIASGLPEIRSTLTIDGTTQTGYFGKPLIEINGENVQNSNGVSINHGAGFATIHVTVKALAINRHLYGIYSRCHSRCDITLQGNFIGTDPTGAFVRKNSIGVYIIPRNYSVITIGGPGLFEGNLISGTGDIGTDDGWPGSAIRIRPDFAAIDTLYTGVVTIRGNKIGTNYNGDAIIGNEDYGVLISEVSEQTNGDVGNIDVTIGGSTSGARNIISGNDATGIDLEVNSAIIQGNYIGTNAAGTAALGNGQNPSFDGSHGIRLRAMNGGNYLIGGGNDGEGNLISGNAHEGIDGASGFYQDMAQLTIQGNKIGTDQSGIFAIGNGFAGVEISEIGNSPFSVTIGGATASAGNLISGNGSNGIEVGGGNVTIYKNLIGTNINGNSAIPNTANGISILDGSESVTIGGTMFPLGIPMDVGNVISGNGSAQFGGSGISVSQNHAGTTFIRRNKIGTDPGGNNAIPNYSHGIVAANGSVVIGADVEPTDGNIISGNGGDGIRLTGSGSPGIGSEIYGNKIGTNAVGGSLLPNGDTGIIINGSANNLIGSGPIGNKTNVVAGNGQEGIVVSGAGSTGNRIEGNYIGTGPILNDLGNGNAGIRFTAGASSNFVGVTNGAGNVIAFNGTGVFAFSGNDNEIRRNAIFSNDGLGIDLGTVGITPNDPGDADTGGNRLQNFPVINRATPNAVSGTLTSTPGVNFTIDFYRVDSCDASGHGEGRYYLGSTLANTNAVTGDGSFEFPASLQIGQIVTATATVTNIIGADDTSEFSLCKTVTPAPAFSFSAATYTVSEAAASRTIIVNRAGATDGPATIDYATSNGTATAGQDYIAASGTLFFADGETLKTFDVSVVGDTTDEDDETINIQLSNPTGGATTAPPSTVTLTITDNDAEPTLSIADVVALETNNGTTSFEFTVALSAASGKQVTVNYATSNGTATSGSDYIATNGGVTFAPGQTAANFIVSVYGDTDVEADETFATALSNPINAAILDGGATGTIQNDDAEYSISGEVRRQDNVPLAGVTVNLAGSQSAQTTTDANGRYAFNGLHAGGNFTVTPSASGYDFTPVNRQHTNLLEDATNAHFTAQAEFIRQVTVISGFATPGQSGGVTVELTSDGTENTLAFSLDYDPTLLSQPVVSALPAAQTATIVTDTATSGRVGISITLPSGQAFPSGVDPLIAVGFTATMTNAASTPVNFADTPYARAITDTAGSGMTATYANGFVFFTQGYESDVSPRPSGNGDGTFTSDDVAQTGSFVVGVETPSMLVNEYQRADSAPKATLGNGSLSVADLVQAGRYASGMDAPTIAGGAVIENFNFDTEKQTPDSVVASTVRVVNSQTSPGSQVTVRIEADSDGTENAFGFTLNYDSSKLSAPFVQLGSDTQAAALFTNTSTPGVIAVAIALPAGQSFTAGTRQLAMIQFNVSPNAAAGTTPIAFVNSPAKLEVADVTAGAVPSTFQDGVINILGPTAANVTIAGKAVNANGKGIKNVAVTLTGLDGTIRTAISNQFGYYSITGVHAGQAYILSGTHKRFAFNPLVINAIDDVADADLVASP